jgi:predicted flap endonuclease-1-like 5' DNA nuclease
MTSLISDNLIIIVIAIVIGLIIGWWVLRRPADATQRRTPSAADPLAELPHEGHSLADEDAAAIADLAGTFLGVDVHAELPGASGPPDNLQTLKGVGAKLAAKLNENGISRFDQLASLTPAQIVALDARMDPFQGRIVKDRLVEQADYLARGDVAGFQATFGNLGSAAP